MSAATGGETTMGDSRRILKKIDADVVVEFRKRGVKYVRLLLSDPNDQYSWQRALETSVRGEAEMICRAAGAEFSWTPSST